MSAIGNPGEWESRRISIIGVAKSFISQLSVGQDLTKISLPAVFQYPYSALELGAHRYLSFCDLLTTLDKVSDPFQRFLQVIRWVMSLTRKEKFEKKPYNPILAEWHYAWVENENGRTDYMGEQAMHHPPITAIRLTNEKKNVKLEGNIHFDVKFHGNSVSVITKGPMTLTLGALDEEYTISKGLADLAIRNVILGTKRLAWEGETVITCKKTGYQATLVYKEEGNWYIANTANGKISKLDDLDNPLYTLTGNLGEIITMTNTNTSQPETFLDYAKITPTPLNYLPLDALDDQNSLKLWTKVNQAIIDDNMEVADSEKRVIEEAQRARRKDNTSFVPRFFALEDETWKYKEKEAKDFIETVRTQASLKKLDVKDSK